MNCHQGIFSDRLHLEMFEVFPHLSLTQLTPTLRSWAAPGTCDVYIVCHPPPISPALMSEPEPGGVCDSCYVSSISYLSRNTNTKIYSICLFFNSR